MNAIRELLLDWPAADSVSVHGRFYDTPEGKYGRVTSILKAYGGGTEGLIKWSATSERAAVLEACGEVYAQPVSPENPPEFIAAVEARIGPARAHQKLLTKAADIGTAIHQMIQWTLKTEIGEPAGQKPVLSDAAEIAFMSWQDWWQGKGLKAFKVEQPVWDPEIGYAGTIDLLALNESGMIELWDWKSSAGVYETHHIQAAAYVHAANRWAPVLPGGIVHLPKSITQDLSAKEYTIGHMYGGRVLSQEQMLDAFKACLTLYNLLMKDAR